MLAVFGAGADRLADDGTIEKQPDAEINQRCDANDHEAVDRNISADDVDLRGDRCRYRTRDQTPEVLDDADTADQHAERGDHGEGQVALIDSSEYHALDQQRHDRGHDYAADNAEPDVAD